MSRELAALGETGLLRLLTSGWKTDPAQIHTGVGDDCAVLRAGRGSYLIFKTDAVVEGVHFTASEKPEWIGRKALGRALSDLAAMGASPIAAVITLGLPPTESAARLKRLYAGITHAATRHRVNLVGGETTRAPGLFLSIALLGECRGYRPVLRSSARPGDLIAVTGRLGATQRRKHLLFEPRLAEGQWLARKKIAAAMMDLSDGLGADLPRLAEASQLGFRLDDGAVPRARGASLSAALNDGEDYELLFTVAPKNAEGLKKKWPFRVPIHFIGKMEQRGPSSSRRSARTYGFDHFKQR